LYSPRISEKLISKNFKVAKAEVIPMTRVVDGILNEALAKIKVETIPCEVKRKSVR